MKLSAKIILGFALTNLVYLLLSTAILFAVWPLIGTTEALNQYVSPTNDSTSELRYNVAEQRSFIRQYASDPNLDQKLLDTALSRNKSAAKELDNITKNLNDPNCVAIRIPAIQEPYSRVKAAFDEATSFLMITADYETKYLQLRRQFSETCQKALDAVDEAIAGEKEAFDNEVETDFSPETITRRYGRLDDMNKLRDLINASWIFFLQGYIRDSQELYNSSMKNMAETEKLMDELIANTKTTYPKLRAAVEKSKGIVSSEMAPLLKATLNQERENDAMAAKRLAATNSLLDIGHEMDDAISAVAAALTEGIAKSVVAAVTVMIIGVVVALISSTILGIFITRSIVRPINVIIDNLTMSAQEVELASSQLTGASNTLASGATENAASLEETSAALEQLSSMTNRNADNAAEANALMDQTKTNVTQAETSMVKVIGAMEEISRSGNEIGKIIKTIDEIAFQTNLLALNAAVEAARAGEAGAGFAVVADEVRNLAIRSADAAKNTADLIETTIGNINSGSEMVNETSEAFKVVETNATKVGSLVSEVASASKEQSQGISQITKAMAEMDKVTQANAATSEQSASAASQLSLQASTLMGVVTDMNVLAHGAGAQAGSRSADGRPRLSAPAPAAPGPSKPPTGGQDSSASNKALPMDDKFDF